MMPYCMPGVGAIGAPTFSALKVRRTLSLQPLTGCGVLKGQGGGMQHQALGHGQRLWVGVHVAAQNGVAQFSHVNTQLMRAAGDRAQQHSASIGLAGQNLVVGQCLLTALGADYLPGSVFPVRGDR